jgi:hypothetical protein
MTKSESQAQPDFISSARTDESARSDGILELGRKLVHELRLEPSVDTLGRWMAHYIADLITKAERATGDERRSVEEECFRAILALWQHRAELPNGKRPFEHLEPIVRAIESLDPDDDTPRYFRSARPERKDWEKSAVDRWLDLALAEAAGAKEGASEIVFRFASETAELGHEEAPDVAVRQRLQGRLSRLEGFIKLARVVVRDLPDLRPCRLVAEATPSR